MCRVRLFEFELFNVSGYGGSVRECIDARPVGGLGIRHVVPGAYLTERITLMVLESHLPHKIVN